MDFLILYLKILFPIIQSMLIPIYFRPWIPSDRRETPSGLTFCPGCFKLIPA